MADFDFKKKSFLSCGDEVTIYIKMENDVVKDVSFEGDGCSISMVSSELLCSISIGKKVKDIKEELLNIRVVFDGDQNKNLNEFNILLEVKNYPTRLKCLFLPIDILDDFLKNS